MTAFGQKYFLYLVFIFFVGREVLSTAL